MIKDYEQELTTAGGQLFTAAAPYGTKPYDLKAEGIDPTIGDPVFVHWKCTEDSNVGTSQDIVIYSSTTGLAGGTEVALGSSGAIAVANLTLALGVRRIAINRALCTHRYLVPKVTTVGADPTAGKIKVWVEKGTDISPSNAALNV